MPRTLVGLLAAVGAAASGLLGMVHGPAQGVALGTAAGIAAVLGYTASPSKKMCDVHDRPV